jgi:para-aminobenzoate synthetase/4-amino-4-deoxychorismate lyase
VSHPSSTPPAIIIRDDSHGRGLAFRKPARLLVARRLDEVAGVVDEVATVVEKSGAYAAGFLSFDAWPAFSPTTLVGPPGPRDSGELPLAWFGLFDAPEIWAALPPADASHLAALSWRPDIEQRDYEERFQRIRAYLAQGDVYQVNYTFRLRAEFSGDPWNHFVTLAGGGAPPPYAAFINTGDWSVLSASPEMFFERNGNRIVSRPMKGTIPRAELPADDEAARQWLAQSEKDRAENLMIVDMVRNDLGRISLPGSVRVPTLFQIEPHATVWQMTSTVEATSSASFPEILQAAFPPASVTGAPKKRALEIIAELEDTPRRLYTGTIGYLAPGGKAQFNVAIRTMLVQQSTGLAEYGVGSGIVWDSRCEDEWNECFAKARILSTPVLG